MNKIQNNAGKTLFSAFGADGIEGRIFRSMAFAMGLGVLASVALWPWRVSTGLLLGGLLALLNHYWLSNSMRAALSVVAFGTKPRIGLAQYVLRYAIVGAVVFIAYQFNVVSLPATIVGLSSFVFALFVEAFREFYFAIIHREEIS